MHWQLHQTLKTLAKQLNLGTWLKLLICWHGCCSLSLHLWRERHDDVGKVKHLFLFGDSSNTTWMYIEVSKIGWSNCDPLSLVSLVTMFYACTKPVFKVITYIWWYFRLFALNVCKRHKVTKSQKLWLWNHQASS